MKLVKGTPCLRIKKLTPSILLLNPEKNILNSNFVKDHYKPVNTTGHIEMVPLCAQKN
jgi:hypothetical protein